MRSLTKIVLGAVLAFSLVVPSATHAASLTTDQVNAVLGLLQSFNVEQKTIDTVKSVLNRTPEVPGTSTSGKKWVEDWKEGKKSCIPPGRMLSLGSKGEDVKNLQQILRDDDDSEFEYEPTGYFGSATMNAMMRFQMRKGIASTSTGVVGPKTREFLSRHCEKENNGLRLGTASGKIAAKTDASITVENKLGKLRTVLVATSTTIKVYSATSTPPSVGSISDLIVGNRVIAEGRPMPDGSLYAKHIKTGPAMHPELKESDDETVTTVAATPQVTQ